MKRIITFTLATFATIAIAAQDMKSTESKSTSSNASGSPSQLNQKNAENSKVNKQASEKLSQKSKDIISDATQAMEATKKSLSKLDEGKKQEAMSLLEEATGKLSMIVARQPDLGLAAYDVSVFTNALITDEKEVKNAKDKVMSLLKDNKVQEARQLLSTLKSETTVSVAQIPLATYPAALKEAARLIDQDKVEDAKSLITGALGTVVVTQTIIPVPLARADYFLSEASILTQKTELNQQEKSQVKDLISQSRIALQLATALGYVEQKQIKDLTSQLDQAISKAESGKFKEIQLSDLRSKISQVITGNAEQTRQAEEAQ